MRSIELQGEVMSFIKYENYVEGKIGGSARALKTIYCKEAISGHSKQEQIESLGITVFKISSKDGIFLSQTHGLTGYNCETGYYFVDKLDPRIPGKLSLTVKNTVNFGGSYLLDLYLKKIKFLELLDSLQLNGNDTDTLKTIIYHKLTSCGGRIKIDDFYDGDIVNRLFPRAVVTSQNVSHIFSKLGDMDLRKVFFKNYRNFLSTNKIKSLIIDSTSLENNIDVPFTLPGSHGSTAVDQMRMILAVDRETSTPLWFKEIPGNQVDVNTLIDSVKEISSLGYDINGVVIDAGYISKDNIYYLSTNNINYCLRAKSSDLAYKSLLRDNIFKFHQAKYHFLFNERRYFGIKEEVSIVINNKTKDKDAVVVKTFGYMFIDMDKSNQEFKKFLEKDDANKTTDKELNFHQYQGGLFVLLSNEDKEPIEVLKDYISRGEVEKVFKIDKSYLDLLPLSKQTEVNIRGYLFMIFLSSVIFIRLLNELKDKSLTNDLLFSRANLIKSDISEETDAYKAYLTSYINPKAKEVFTALGFKVPEVVEYSKNVVRNLLGT